jgi:hypothetical protein
LRCYNKWILYFRYDSALLWAVRNGHEAVVRLPLEKGAELGPRTVKVRHRYRGLQGRGTRQLCSYYLKKALSLSPTFCSGRPSRCATFVAVIRFRAGTNFLDASLTLVIQ